MPKIKHIPGHGNSVTIAIFRKKGNQQDIKNYKPEGLLLSTYKYFRQYIKKCIKCCTNDGKLTSIQ